MHPPHGTEPILAMADLIEFEYFPKLPTELQYMVWNLALSETHRVIRYTLSSEHPHQPNSWRHVSISRQVPALLHVCTSSRAMARKHYYERHVSHNQVWSCGLNNRPTRQWTKCVQAQKIPSAFSGYENLTMEQTPGQWWNPDYDFVFLDTKRICNTCPAKSICNATNGPWCVRYFNPRIKYIALTMKDWKSMQGWYKWLLHCRGIKYIFLMANRQKWEKPVGGRRLPSTRRVPYHGNPREWTQESDQAWEEQKQLCRRWGTNLIEDFARTWARLRDSNSLDLYDDVLSAGSRLKWIWNLKIRVVESEEEIARRIARRIARIRKREDGSQGK
ncbi:uncharacterized protein PAC_05042 [Phialocephala subalpina]|uniref:2EXR domain-containing protein n=1 Tax=Phialocephala subalpina TaxID=576137 RepID=A0A1L7WQV8_9HELO|nr:uncharacterized protein PAC_05042 [Phialocephala subalpina]